MAWHPTGIRPVHDYEVLAYRDHAQKQLVLHTWHDGQTSLWVELEAYKRSMDDGSVKMLEVRANVAPVAVGFLAWDGADLIAVGGHMLANFWEGHGFVNVGGRIRVLGVGHGTTRTHP